MIVAIVRFALPAPVSLDEAQRMFESSAPVFDFVGVELDDAIRADLDAMGAQNTMDAVKKITGRQDDATVELTEEELNYIVNFPRYIEIKEKYNLKH